MTFGSRSLDGQLYSIQGFIQDFHQGGEGAKATIADLRGEKTIVVLW